jgi:hypothetical protein
MAIVKQEPEASISFNIFLPMPESFFPGKTDVVCGKGNAYSNLPGNMLYTAIIRRNMHSYLNTPKRNEKSLIIKAALGELTSQGCRFVKKDRKTNQWFELSQKKVHEKVGHAFRDMPRRQFPWNEADETPSMTLVSSINMGGDVLIPKENDIPERGGESPLPDFPLEWEFCLQRFDESRDDHESEWDLDSIDYLVASQLLSE